MSGLGDALARAAGWLVEPDPEATWHGGGRAENGPKFLDCVAPGRQIQERDARVCELRLVTTLAAEETSPSRVPPAARPLTAVVGLAPCCGTTTVARALAATLARRDHSGAAIVASRIQPVGSMSARPAARLAARMASIGVPATAAGRLCLASAEDPVGSIPRLGPLVLDLGTCDASSAAAAEPVILVAPGESEPALADLAAQKLKALTVVVCPDAPERWEGRAFVTLQRSRLGARLAAAGWEPRGEFGRAIARIADACEEAA